MKNKRENTRREAIQYSLRVYRDMREQILKDTEKKNTDLYLGLHSKGAVREIYMDRYHMIWLMAHLDCFEKIMEKNVLTGQKIYTEVFAKSLVQFLHEYGQLFFCMETASKALKNNQSVLEQMIDASISWEQGYDKVRLQMKKFDEEYQRLVKGGKL